MIMRLITILLVIGLSLSVPLYAQEKLTWQDCVKAARANNPSLISAQENVAQKKAAEDIAAGSRYPALDANAGAGRTQTKAAGQNSYDYGVTASQTIFDGYKTQAAVKAGRENTRAAQAQYRFASAAARHALRAAFVDVLKCQELINVLADIAKIRTTDLAMIRLRYASGREHSGSLATAQASLSLAQHEVNQAKRNLTLARQSLAAAMGMKNDPGPQAVQEEFSLPAMDETPDFAALASQHPSVKTAAAGGNIARLSIDTARADFFPQVSADASLAKNGSRWPPDGRQTSYGLRIEFPLFEGGLRQARLEQAWSTYRQSQADQRVTIDSVALTLQKNWLVAVDTCEAVAVQKEVLAAALERSKIAEAEYSNGFITFDSWTIIQNDYINAKKAYLNAQANALYAQADWQFAKGETLDYGQD